MPNMYFIVPQPEVDESELDEILLRIKKNAQREAILPVLDSGTDVTILMSCGYTYEEALEEITAIKAELKHKK